MPSTQIVPAMRLRTRPSIQIGIAHLFIGWRNFRSGTLIIWSNGTTRKQNHAQHADSAGDALADSTFHSGGAHKIHCFVPPGAGAAAGCAICTCSPATIESGGLVMTDSFPFKPA